jgi:hypothetical protein
MKRDKSNPVAKNLNKYNKPATHTDRKKAMKKGEVKHKKSILKDDEQQTDTSNRTNAAAKKPQNYVDPETGKTKTRMVPVHKDVQTEKLNPGFSFSEKLNPSDGIRTYIDDFQKSDAPQFQGKSKEKRKEMAIAAYLDAKRGTKKESVSEGAVATGTVRKEIAKAGGKKISQDNNHITYHMDGKKHKVPHYKNFVSSKDYEAHRAKLGEAYNPRAASALSHAANKMYGRGHPEQDKPSVGVAKQSKKPSSKADIFRALDKKYGSPKKKTGIYAKEAVDPADTGGAEETNMAVKQIAAMRHFLDGIESRVKKEGDMEEWFQNKLTKANDYLKTLYSYGKGDVAESVIEEVEQIHEEQDPLLADENPVTENGQDFVRVDESQKLANKRAELRKKMFGDANYLTPAQRKELDKAAKAELKKERETKKAAPAPKTTTKTAKGKTHTGRADPADQNIFMQMRKAQDAAKASGRKMHNIKVGPKSTVSVPTSLVNKALAKHDSLQKPEDKRKLKIQLIKALRAKAK